MIASQPVSGTTEAAKVSAVTKVPTVKVPAAKPAGAKSVAAKAKAPAAKTDAKVAAPAANSGAQTPAPTLKQKIAIAPVPAAKKTGVTSVQLNGSSNTAAGQGKQ